MLVELTLPIIGSIKHVEPNNEATSLVSVFSGVKIKKERPDSDDLFCEENMLIIDGEYAIHAIVDLNCTC